MKLHGVIFMQVFLQFTVVVFTYVDWKQTMLWFFGSTCILCCLLDLQLLQFLHFYMVQEVDSHCKKPKAN